MSSKQIPITTETYITSLPSTPYNPTSSQTSIDIEDITYQEFVDTDNTVVNINANKKLMKVYYCLIILITELPFLILYCYFSVNDNSCSYKYVDGTPFTGIHSYLAISAVLLSFLMFISLLTILHTNFENTQSINRCVMEIVMSHFIFIIIMFVWSIAVGLTFFNSNVNSYCSPILRNFMNFVLFIFYILGIICLCILCRQTYLEST